MASTVDHATVRDDIVASPDVLLALDPTTAPARLARLARSRDRRVRAAVVANPNTSLDTLQRIGLAFPESLAANQLLDWLAVEDADYLAQLPERLRHRLLMVTHNEGLLWWSVRFGNDTDRRAALGNPRAGSAVVTWCAGRGDPQVGDLARHHVHGVGGLPARPGVAGESELGDQLPPVDATDFAALCALEAFPSWLLAAAGATR